MNIKSKMNIIDPTTPSRKEPMRVENMSTGNQPNHSHAWRGSWYRPMLIDEDSLDALTIARMTDHNVRGSDDVMDNAPDEMSDEMTDKLTGSDDMQRKKAA